MRVFFIHFLHVDSRKDGRIAAAALVEVSFSIKFKTRVDEFCPPITKRTLSHNVSGIAPAENICIQYSGMYTMHTIAVLHD